MNNKTIGEFAKMCGVSVETIRFYQRQGIIDIPSRGTEPRSGTVRRYGDKDILRLQFILSAKKAGFTLKEIKELLELDAQNDRERVRAIAQNRIEQLDAKITELTEARDSLDLLVQECKKTNFIACPILLTFAKR